MIEPRDFFGCLKNLEISPFAGVPCSIISSLIAYAVDHPDEVEHVNPAHESQAMAYAAGAYMATGRLPMVYMQNSGLGNVMNPLTSLNNIYDVPALLLVTWRAEKGWGDDAPEHWIMGRDMEQFLKALKLPYLVLSAENWQNEIKNMADEARKTGKPAALVVRKGLFAKYQREELPGSAFEITDTEAITMIKQAFPDAVFLSTTGMISRKSYSAAPTPDFYMMGSMGLILGIADGCAEHVKKRVVALDGDGAALMHLGQMALAGRRRPENLIHVIIDNEAHSSTGGQPTVSSTVDFAAVARACGYPQAFSIRTKEELTKALSQCLKAKGPILLHLKVKSGPVDHGLKRISDDHTCPEVKDLFIKRLKE
jgi:phosphonopyruvate decarboxylase